MAAELMQQLGFDFVLVTAGRYKAHRAHVRICGNFRRAAHGRQFRRILHQAHRVEFGAHVANGRWRALAAAAFGAHLVQCGGDALVPARVVAEGKPQRRLVGDQFR